MVTPGPAVATSWPIPFEPQALGPPTRMARDRRLLLDGRTHMLWESHRDEIGDESQMDNGGERRAAPTPEPAPHNSRARGGRVDDVDDPSGDVVGANVRPRRRAGRLPADGCG